mmetsp:Transcript_120709/g.257817  ORF Transcript_120709/g.257817 Transcript_120709/m.257817 type:complete len:82 (+) Transcript_120709:765-1010(+)
MRAPGPGMAKAITQAEAAGTKVAANPLGARDMTMPREVLAEPMAQVLAEPKVRKVPEMKAPAEEAHRAGTSMGNFVGAFGG